jgi:hypothetical protein
MLKTLIFWLLELEGGEKDMARLWTVEIINGAETFAHVPAKLKEKVRQLLIVAECEDLIVE